MTEGPRFTKGCYRTVVSADFNAGQSTVTSGLLTTFRLYPRQSDGLTNAFMSVTSDGRLRMDPRSCTSQSVFFAEDNPVWSDSTSNRQVVTVEATMQLEWG